jgi:2-methylisocitrate lyase-like PEP mutase family enzyme
MNSDLPEPPRRRLRRLLASEETTLAPGVYDAFTARIVEELGFGALYLGGNALGIHLGKGQPFVTLTETVECASRILRTVNVPLIVDAGGGFGEPNHVYHTVRELEACGVTAIHIDDQPYPKRAAYHLGEGTLAPMEEAVRKFRLAASARRDPDLLLIARTDALRVTKSVPEAIARGAAYLEAGAEALMVLDLTPSAAAEIREAFPTTPLVWIGGVSHPIPSHKDLTAAGFALAVYPFNTAAAVNDAVTTLWLGLADWGVIEQSASVLSNARAETLELVRMQRDWDIERGLYPIIPRKTGEPK